MFRRILIASCPILFAMAVAADAPKPSAADANRLVQQLGSAKHTEREAALRALDSLGLAAMPALREGAKSSDAEISRRCSELLEKLDRQSESTAALAATKVKLKAANSQLGDVVRDLSQQSKIRLQLAREPVDLAQRSVSIDTGEVSFLEALDVLCKAAKISIRSGTIDPIGTDNADANPPNVGNLVFTTVGGPGEGEETIVLQDGALPDTPTAYVGGVRVRLVPDRWVNRDRKPGEEMRWTLEILSEPRVRWQSKPSFQFETPSGLKIETAAAHGHDAPAAGMAAIALPAMPVAGRMIVARANGIRAAIEPTIVSRGISRLELPVFVKATPGAHSSFPEVKGSLAGTVMAPPAALVAIADVTKDKPTATAKDGTKISVHDFERADDGTVTMKVDVEKAGAGLPGGGAVVINRVARINVAGARNAAKLVGVNDGSDEGLKLFDENGKPFDVNVTGTELKPAGAAMNMTYTLHCTPPANAGKPRKLELHGPRPASVESNFILKNVPAP